MSEILEDLLVATETPVVEMEELQGIIAEGQERGFLPSATARQEIRVVKMRRSIPGRQLNRPHELTLRSIPVERVQPGMSQ